MRNRALSGGLTLRTAVASALLALVVGAVFTVLIVAIADQRRSGDLVQHSRTELSVADRLLKLLIDLETGQRGFVITRQERFLGPWEAARTALPTGALRLARNADDAGQAARARAIARAATSYIRDYSVPLVDAARRRDPAARSVAATAEGKRRVDSLRVQFDLFREKERDLLQERQDHANFDSDRAVVLAVGGLVGSVVLILLLGTYVARRVAAPLRQAAAMARRLAGGEATVRMPVTGPAEIGELEQAFNSMASSLEASRAELTASRARVVAAGDQSRRRIERDLHDGAQQRLVAVALELRETEAAVPEELQELRDRLAATSHTVTEVLEELQNISRGINPAILSAGGIGPALKTLARRSAIPVELDVGTPGRLGEQVELTAYFVVSEALANAAKHSQGSSVEVRFETEDGLARLVVRDNGVGGARVGRGSGLVNLADRVEALGGRFEVVSPPGGGTELRAELPLED